MKNLFALCLAATVALSWLWQPLLSAPPTPVPGTRIIRTPFRILFQAYDGDPRKPEAITFQVNALNLKQPVAFLKLGDTIPNTKLKLTAFKYRVLSSANIEEHDASELSLTNTDTNELVTLVYSRVTEIPNIRHITPAPAK